MKVFVTLLLLVVFCVGLHAQESHPLKEAFIEEGEKMKALFAEELPDDEKFARFKLRLDTLFQIAFTDGFADLVLRDGGDINEVLVMLYRLDENYEDAKKSVRELMKIELEDKQWRLQTDFINILKEEHHYRPPLYARYLDVDTPYELQTLEKSSLDAPDIAFLGMMGEYELALSMISPEGKEIRYNEAKYWRQNEFVKVIQYRESREAIKEALATAKIELDLGKSTEKELSGQVTVFGYTFKLYIPAGMRELLMEDNEEDRKKTMREIFESTSFYRMFTED